MRPSRLPAGAATLVALAVSALLAAGAIACTSKPAAGSDEHAADAPGATFAVAASLRHAFPELDRAFRASASAYTGARLAPSYGGSGTLRKQVQGGAPIDAVLFASAAPVDALVTEGLVDARSRAVVATNRLALVAPKGTPVPEGLTFESLADKLPPDAKLALGEPGAVPAGRYAKDALTTLGLWQPLQERLVYAGDVSAVLAYARRGEVTAAVVYGTDVAGANDEVVVVDEADGPWAPTPEIVVGLTTPGSGDPGADATSRAFLAFVASEPGQAILRAHGFGPPPSAP